MGQGCCKLCGGKAAIATAVADEVQPFPSPPSDPTLVVGPVIGKVTDRTARILVECSHDVKLRCQLQVAGQDALLPLSVMGVAVEQEQVLSLRAGRPAAFVFAGLTPATKYAVHFEGAQVLVDGCSFRTLPQGGWSLGAGQLPRFAIVSCNSIHETRHLSPDAAQADLWFNLETQLRQGEKPLDYVLHIGDNVYQDFECETEKHPKNDPRTEVSKWAAALQLMSGLPKERWSERSLKVAELFRTQYRETWGHGPTRWVLANAPNLTVLDDHECRDDWGDRPEDSQAGSLDRFLGDIAYQVYGEYQRQLREDISSAPTHAFHFHTFGDVALAFLELRACKSFHRKPEDEALPMLGVAQWRALEAALSPGGEFSSCRALLLFSPEPVAYISNTPTMGLAAAAEYLDDLYGQWSATKYQPEVPRLLNLLATWRTAQRGRDVLVVGGDVHEGGWTDMVCKDLRIRQLTTSAISNTLGDPKQAIGQALARSGLSAIDNFDLTGGWCCRHSSWTPRRNYAVVDIGTGCGKVSVRVIAAHGLRNADWVPGSGKSDPYVVVSLGGQEQRTQVAADTLNPQWDSAEFEFKTQEGEDTLSFKVWDQDVGIIGDDALGEASVHVFGLPFNDRVRLRLELQGSSAEGELEVELFFQPASTELKDKHDVVIIGGQLVTSDGSQVEVLNRRTTRDAVFTLEDHIAALSADIQGQINRAGG